MTIGEYIKELRNQRKMTQKELAEKASLSVNALINYEKNKRTPSIQVLNKIGAALDVNPSEFINISTVNMDLKIIGNNIKILRRNNKLTQKQLAEKIGKATRTIQQYEGGTIEAPYSVLLKIADVLNVPITSLTDEIQESKAENAWSKFDEKYPNAGDDYKHYKALMKYLEELGFTVDYDPISYEWVENIDDYGNCLNKSKVPTKIEYIIKRDNLSATFTEEEITEMQNLTKEIIEGKIYKKALEQQNK